MKVKINLKSLQLILMGVPGWILGYLSKGIWGLLTLIIIWGIGFKVINSLE